MNAKIVSTLLFISLVLNPKISIKAQQVDTLPNRQTIFSDDFSRDLTGKFPENWTSNRPGEVVTLKNLPGKWFKMHTEGTYLPIIQQEFSKRFTITFDFIFQATGNGNNTVELTIFHKPSGSINDALFPGSSGIKIVFETFIVSCLCYDNLNPAGKMSGENRARLIQPNNVTKISIRVDNQQLHVFVNGLECLNMSVCNNSDEILNAIRFYLWGSQAEPLISNLKIFSDQER